MGAVKILSAIDGQVRVLKLSGTFGRTGKRSGEFAQWDGTDNGGLDWILLVFPIEDGTNCVGY